MKPVAERDRAGAERELEAIFQYASLGIVFTINQVMGFGEQWNQKPT